MDTVVTLQDVILQFVFAYHETRGQAPQPYYLQQPITRYLKEILDESMAEELSSQFKVEVMRLKEEGLLNLREGQWLELTDTGHELVKKQKRNSLFSLVRQHVATAE